MNYQSLIEDEWGWNEREHWAHLKCDRCIQKAKTSIDGECVRRTANGKQDEPWTVKQSNGEKMACFNFNEILRYGLLLLNRLVKCVCVCMGCGAPTEKQCSFSFLIEIRFERKSNEWTRTTIKTMLNDRKSLFTSSSKVWNGFYQSAPSTPMILVLLCRYFQLPLLRFPSFWQWLWRFL